MPTSYEDVRSEYIRARLQETTWEDHGYIDDLIKLAYYIQNPPRQFASGMQFNHLRSKHPHDLGQLLEELDPEQLQSEREKQERFAQNVIAQNLVHLEADKEQLESWLRAGGLR